MPSGVFNWGQVAPQGGDGGLKVNDGHRSDAFERLAVASPINLFDGTFSPYYDTDLWESYTVTGGSVSHSTTTRALTLSINTTASGKAGIQSRQYLHYQPGRGQLIFATGVIGSASTSNVIKRIGYFDDDNGIFFEMKAGVMGVVVRTKTSGSVEETRVAQTSWNLDTVNGSGNSRINIDWAKRQIFGIQFQWLGVGQVVLGVDVDGKFIPVHAFNHANSAVGGSSVLPYMQTGSLPVRYEILNSGSTGDADTLTAICASVISEGGEAVERGKNHTAVASTARDVSSRRALVSLRPTLDWDDVANQHVFRGMIALEDINVMGLNSTGSGYQLVELVYNPTLTGTPTWSRTTGSAIEYSVHGDASAGAFTGGTVISSFIIPSGGGVNVVRQTIDKALNITSRWPLTADKAGTASRVLSVAVTNLSGTNPTAVATINWREIY